MSLDRAALRLAAVMSIANGYEAPFPTIARDGVFDSRVDPIEGGKIGDMAPIVLVFTDDDDGESLSGNNGGPPFRHIVKLIFELSIGMVGQLIDGQGAPLKDDQDEPILGLLPIATEPELELMLDLFEHQIMDVFRRPLGNPWAMRLLDKHIVRVEQWSSMRFVEREGQKRLALRQIVASVQLPQQDDMVVIGDAPPATIPEPLGSLLDDIIEADGPYAESAQAMQDLLNENGGFTPTALPPLERVRFKEANLGGGNLAGDAPARPDGVAEAELPQD